ncbi:MAG: sigma-54-dependent transcriptional regulator [Nannocystales bacterium]
MSLSPIRARTGHGEPPLVLVVDANPAPVVLQWLRQADFRARLVSKAEALLDALSTSLPDLVLLSPELPGLSGVDAIREIRARHGTVPIVMLAGEAPVPDLMLAGAYDFVTDPTDRTKLLTTARNACERHRLTVKLADLERQARDDGFAGIAGRSPKMRRLFGQMSKLALSDISLLIHGERGTGKELIARALHDASARATGPYVAFNCAWVPESRGGAELFGQQKEPLVAATETLLERFEQANGGTLFLDGVAELSSSLQTKLLHALHRRRLDGVGPVHPDFRIIVSTHRDLRAMVARGEFREDLYARLAGFELEVPPLRERVGDVGLLAQHVLRREVGSDGVLPRFDDASLSMLRNHRWPGNVRELREVVRYAASSSEDGCVRPHHLPESLHGGTSEEAANGIPHAPEVSGRNFEAPGGHNEQPANAPSFFGTLAELEREAIERELERWNGNVTAVGKALGIGRTTLYRRLKAYGLR